jgi:hypothetical protein
MSNLEEQIKVHYLALQELKIQLIQNDFPLLRAEYNVIVGKINEMSKQYEQEKAKETRLAINKMKYGDSNQANGTPF